MPLLQLYLHSLMHAALYTDNVQPPHTMPQISERLHALRVIGVRAPIMCSHIDGRPKLKFKAKVKIKAKVKTSSLLLLIPTKLKLR